MNNKKIREARKEQAEKRQAQYDALTLDQKIERAKNRVGESSKELVKLYKLKLAQ